MHLYLLKMLLFSFLVIFPVGNALSQVAKTESNSTRIMLKPKMSEAIKFVYGVSLLLRLQDDSVLVVGGMLDPLVPRKKIHLVAWKLESLKDFNSVIEKEGPATFGMPLGTLHGGRFMMVHAEQTLNSVEIEANVFDVAIRMGMVDRSFGLLRLDQAKIKDYVIIPNEGLQTFLADDDFLKVPEQLGATR